MCNCCSRGAKILCEYRVSKKTAALMAYVHFMGSCTDLFDNGKTVTKIA